MDWLKLIHGTTPASPCAFTPGDDVRVWFRILEQGKERLGQFEGIVIRVRGSGPSRTFTVRRMTHGVGVERVFPFDAPVIDRVELLRSGKAKRSRLYFLRHVVKKTRLEAAEGPEGASAEKDSATEPEAALAKEEPAKP
ncbi:MAG: 50S ribosomal protein L19 [Candidatus Omnitrophica bacterium]|nr:50S ribosomal protein L19 [Candidatus Omnitrophota bacterium]